MSLFMAESFFEVFVHDLPALRSFFVQGLAPAAGSLSSFFPLHPAGGGGGGGGGRC